MTEQPHTGNPPTTDEPLDPHRQPAAGGSDHSEPAQGEGEEDSH